VLDRARALFDSGELPLALEFADVAIEAFDDSQAHLLKADVLAALAELPRANKLTANMYRRLSANERLKASPSFAAARRE
jgi:hypothetical protein